MSKDTKNATALLKELIPVVSGYDHALVTITLAELLAQAVAQVPSEDRQGRQDLLDTIRDTILRRIHELGDLQPARRETLAH